MNQEKATFEEGTKQLLDKVKRGDAKISDKGIEIGYCPNEFIVIEEKGYDFMVEADMLDGKLQSGEITISILTEDEKIHTEITITHDGIYSPQACIQTMLKTTRGLAVPLDTFTGQFLAEVFDGQKLDDIFDSESCGHAGGMYSETYLFTGEKRENAATREEIAISTVDKYVRVARETLATVEASKTSKKTPVAGR